MKIRLFIVALLVVALPACSSDAPPDASPPTQSAESELPPPPEAIRYKALEDMVEVAESHLDEPVTFQPIGVGSNDETLRDMGSLDWTNTHINIYLFDNSEQRDLWVPQMKAEFELIVGPNWIVIPFGQTEVLHSMFGGEIVPQQS